MGALRATWLIASKELRSQVRNHTILVIGLIAPLSLAFVLNFVFGGSAAGQAPVSFEVGLANSDGSAPGSFKSVLDRIGPGLLDIREYADETAARRGVESGEVGAAWVLTRGGEGPPSVITVIGDVDMPHTGRVARSIAARYATGVDTVDLAVRVAVDTGAVALPDAGGLAREVATSPPAAALVPIQAEAREPLDLTTSLTAGLALFFGFFVAGLPLTSLLEERGGGTLARLLIAPLPRGAIVAGKALAGIVLAVASLATLMVASTVVMGASWGPPAGALLLAAAFAVAAIGVMTAAGSVATTVERAGNVQGIAAVGLGLLGGAFVPIPAAEGSLVGLIRDLTPHGWFLEGLTALRAEGLAGVAGPAVALVAIGVVFGAVGVRATSRMLRR